MANFKFQNFWPKKMDFFCHGSPILPLPVLNFFLRAPNLLKVRWLKLEKNCMLQTEVGFP